MFGHDEAVLEDMLAVSHRSEGTVFGHVNVDVAASGISPFAPVERRSWSTSLSVIAKWDRFFLQDVINSPRPQIHFARDRVTRSTILVEPDNFASLSWGQRLQSRYAYAWPIASKPEHSFDGFNRTTEPLRDGFHRQALLMQSHDIMLLCGSQNSRSRCANLYSFFTKHSCDDGMADLEDLTDHCKCFPTLVACNHLLSSPGRNMKLTWQTCLL